MPAVNVSDLYLNPDDGTIAAGTYGRGLWKSDLFTDCLDMTSVTDSGTPLGGVHWISAVSSVTSNAEYRTDMGTEVHYNAGQNIVLTPGFRAEGQMFFETQLVPCPPPPEAPLAPQNPTGIWADEARLTFNNKGN